MAAVVAQGADEGTLDGFRDESVASRDAVRARWTAAIPRWYSPWGHLAFPSVVGLGVIAGAVGSIHGLRAWQACLVPLVLLFSNAVEWRVHKHVLHRRFWPLEDLYFRHTPNHHRVFVTSDMVVRSPLEFRFVLMPFWAIVALFLITAPVAVGLELLAEHNLAALYLATSMAYVLSYEWLHLAYHLPADGFVGRRIGSLRRHHATHHDPRLMQRYNFNVTVPLWDWILGTIRRD